MVSYAYLIVILVIFYINSMWSYDRENLRKHMRLIQDCYSSNMNISSSRSFPNRRTSHELDAMAIGGYNREKVSWIGCILCAMSKQSEMSRYLPLTTAASSVNDKNKRAFDQIYKDRIWGDSGGGSGAGSDLSMAFGAVYIIRLVMFKYGLTNLLDAPCGAVSDSWTQTLLMKMRIELPCFRYHGVDVVSTVIEKNTKAFESYPWISFTAADISSSAIRLPQNFDLILSRDALQHLPYSSIAGALNNYCKSKAMYLLVGSYIDITDKNKDLAEPGGCFEINLLVSPFNFPQPLEIFAEKAKESQRELFPTKYLLLYSLEMLCQSSGFLSYTKTYVG